MSRSGAGPGAGRFVIYRIVGNDLPPRHQAGDCIKIAQKIIDSESDFENCEKRWLLNRLADRETEQRLHDLITGHGYRCDRIAFDETRFSHAFLKPDLLPQEHRPFVEDADLNNHGSWSEWSVRGRVKSRQLKRMIERRPLLPLPMYGLAKEWIIREKSQAVVGINQARNRALELGFDSDAEWVLPLDGWSYFSDAGWASFVEAAGMNADIRYVSIPIVRSAIKYLAAFVMPRSWRRDAEPQVAVHRMAAQRFDERLRYGHCNKSEFLWRVGVPGYRLRIAAWDPHDPNGKAEGELAVPGGRIRRTPNRIGSRIALDMKMRWHSRFEGVLALSLEIGSRSLERKVTANRDSLKPVFSSNSAGRLSPEDHNGADKLLADLAEEYVNQIPTGVTDKPVGPPGGELANYFSAPKYWRAEQGNYKRRDGEQTVQATIGSAQSRNYDRTSLDECIRRANILTAAGAIFGRPEFLKQAAVNLKHWFVDPATRALPSARFAQFHEHATERQRDPVNPFGLIDFRDLWTLAYIVPQLHQRGALSDAEEHEIRRWCAAFFADVVNGKQGQTAYQAGNNIGTFTHLLLLSLAIVSRNFRDAAQLLNAAPLRLCAQTDGSGSQPAELTRTRPLHYSLFNVAAWVCLATFMRGAGSDLWTYTDNEKRSVCRMIHACAAEREKFSDYADDPQQFDDRIERLLRLVPANACDRELLNSVTRRSGICWQNHPDEGLPPLWPHFQPETDLVLA